ncbi:MAG: class I SAM-dependent methyltransferase [Gammaproteobacteria bacterium]
MALKDAVDWHQENAKYFDSNYVHDKAFIERFAVWTKVMDQYSDENNHVLDIGCGSGILSCYLAERNKSVIGIDGSAAMLKICESRKQDAKLENVNFLTKNISDLGDVISEKADLIICSSVLEYLDDLDESLELITSFLKDNGVFILSMPNRQSLYRKLEPVMFKLTGRPKYYKFVQNVGTVKEIDAKLNVYGLKVLDSSFYAKTKVLSSVMHALGRPQNSDNLFIVVARKS